MFSRCFDSIRYFIIFLKKNFFLHIKIFLYVKFFFNFWVRWGQWGQWGRTPPKKILHIKKIFYKKNLASISKPCPKLGFDFEAKFCNVKVSLFGRAGVQPVTESEHLNVLAFTPDQSPIACTSLVRDFFLEPAVRRQEEAQDGGGGKKKPKTGAAPRRSPRRGRRQEEVPNQTCACYGRLIRGESEHIRVLAFCHRLKSNPTKK